GKNLALNIESRGYKVAIFNRTGAKTEKVVKDHADKQLVPSYTAFIIYGCSLFVLYTCSTLFHGLYFTRAREVFRIFDHSGVYVLIAGT
ncbi:hemolysin III family protein, partial [Klebsiella pneumoniae]|nr:hemolysin III family protein [Klebsiella pneumoniae]